MANGKGPGRRARGVKGLGLDRKIRDRKIGISWSRGMRGWSGGGLGEKIGASERKGRAGLGDFLGSGKLLKTVSGVAGTREHPA